MTPELLREILSDVATRAARKGLLPDAAEAGPPVGVLFRPVDARSPGVAADWVSPVALRWAPTLELEPHRLAGVLARGLTEQPSIAAVEVAPSGLMTITLTDLSRSQIIETVLADGRYALAAECPAGPLPEATTEPIHDCAQDAAPAPDAAQVTDPDTVPDTDSLPDTDPLWPVQHAHARLCRLVRNAEALGVGPRSVDFRHELTHGPERLLQVALADLPQRLAGHEGDRVAQVRALVDLASLSDGCDLPLRPTTVGAGVEPAHGVRLALAQAAQRVLRNGLARLGATAPERM